MNFFLTENGGGSWMSLILIAVLILFFWLFILRPQKKQQKEANEMRASLQIGDEITTIGGIIGKIVSIKDETLVLETTGSGTKIRILSTAVQRVDVKAEDAIH